MGGAREEVATRAEKRPEDALADVELASNNEWWGRRRAAQAHFAHHRSAQRDAANVLSGYRAQERKNAAERKNAGGAQEVVSGPSRTCRT